MYAGLRFSLETVDGYRLGKLAIPYSQIAQWINFLTSPHYDAQVIFAEQNLHTVEIYFQACEGLYSYLENRIHPNPYPESVHTEMAFAS
ncbi:MAG: hypothetical protein KME16_18875 [Scytolyngbya sp. HA4215-MV1]|jgi:hypothetical protein|nr:hypothetical protein [Scytolyngbya sp. HA4215-MV1]